MKTKKGLLITFVLLVALVLPSASAFSQDEKTELQGNHNNNRRDGVRQDMTEHNTEVACTGGLRREDVVVFLDGKGHAAHDPDITGDGGDAERQDDVLDAAAEYRRQQQGEHDHGERHEDIGKPHIFIEQV